METSTMRMASWHWGGREHVGTVSPDGREATPLAVADPVLGVLPLIQRLARGEGLPSAAGARLPVEVIRLRAPLPRPLRSLFCVGRNYHAHAKELAGTVFRETMPQEDPWPIVFTKLPECVIGPFDAVRLPGDKVSVQIDYESELAVVIGRGGRDISRSRAMDHVFGYTIVNDVTARDVQMRHQQWDLGKSFDTFCPMGPWIVTADELDGRATRVRGWVTPRGGSVELRQDGQTKDMIHDIASLIETCSRGITLYPGDVIATGTPAGVGMGLDPPRWLSHGDVVRVEIDGIGAIENRFESS
jgi:2-keto-4-pentenoate hydratase/2-oxohepta-3-ene-1,7-dioic acid hydratase in catechol pathway